LSRARYEKVFIPHRAYWSTPFAKWQGSFATQHPIRLAAQVGKAALAERGISGDALESIVLGVTVPSRQSFWGAPWLATQLGLENITGPTISHACATSAVVVATAAAEVELGGGATLAIAADRTSNGPPSLLPRPDRARWSGRDGGLGLGQLQQRPQHPPGDGRNGRGCRPRIRHHPRGAGRADVAPLRAVLRRSDSRGELPRALHGPGRGARYFRPASAGHCDG